MKVAIAGYGAEGQSSYRYFTNRGEDVTIVTTKVSPDYPVPDGAQAIVADDAFAQLEDFDVVVRTPPMRPDSIHTRGKVWTQANEFMALCPAPVIGVTGTKGKGTTCSLIAAILRASGQRVHLVGNIGVPPLDLLPSIQPSDVVVFEMSSFQLWDLQKSPQIAVVLMIEPDHLDIHRDMDEYVGAKANIARFQSERDTVIYHPTNAFSQQIAELGSGRRVRYANADGGGVYVREAEFIGPNGVICSVDAVQLPGAHNQDNACAAITAALVAGADPAFVEAGLRAFTGLPHRLKYVRTVNDVEYFDDSIATTPGSAIAALRSFPGRNVIILGGSDKGADYTEIIETCKAVGASVIAIGQTGERIEQLCVHYGVPCEREEGGMPMVVSRAARMAQPGSRVLLSPASASFDQYKSYSDRGDQFIAAVGGL